VLCGLLASSEPANEAWVGTLTSAKLDTQDAESRPQAEIEAAGWGWGPKGEK